jgi:hypothetical protein
LTWGVFCTDASGEQVHETWPDWATARETCRGFIDMLNPKNSAATFHRELDMARPDHSFHATDGVFQFAIESL